MPSDRSTAITLVLLACLLCSCETVGTHLAQSRSAETSQDILISEILASNTSTNFDPDYSASSDWIEIHNAGEQAVDLQGFFLTDDLETPTKWQISVSTVVPAAGFVLFWADGRNESWNRNRKVWRDDTAFEKWRFLLYDLDRGFGDPETNWLRIITSFDLSLGALLENAEFQDAFVRRFSNALNAAFEPERIVDVIDELQAGIAPEMPRHIARWKDECKEPSVCGISSMEAWYDQVELMREFARQRPAYVWQHLANRFGASGTVELVLNVQESEGGTVFINDLQVPEDHFTYTSLADIPLQLEAVPNKGYRFLGWQGIDQDGESISPVLTTDCTITAMFAPIEHSNGKYGLYLFAGLLVLALGVGLFRHMSRRRAGPRGGFKR